jgi:hypothetical protein
MKSLGLSEGTGRMRKRSLYETLTSPLPPRPPPPKYPLFTRDFFSTKSFGPGHIFGAAALVFGVAGLAKLFIGLGREEAERGRQQALRSSQPLPRPEGNP